MTGKYDSELVDIEIRIHAETEKAWLVSTTGERKDAIWIPKSQAEICKNTLTCPAWLAIEKGLL